MDESKLDKNKFMNKFIIDLEMIVVQILYRLKTIDDLTSIKLKDMTKEKICNIVKENGFVNTFANVYRPFYSLYDNDDMCEIIENLVFEMFKNLSFDYVKFAGDIIRCLINLLKDTN